VWDIQESQWGSLDSQSLSRQAQLFWTSWLHNPVGPIDTGSGSSKVWCPHKHGKDSRGQQVLLTTDKDIQGTFSWLPQSPPLIQLYVLYTRTSSCSPQVFIP
jgi:hypothetical protein